MKNGHDNGSNGFSPLAFQDVSQALALGQSTDYIGGCSTPAAIGGTLAGLFVGTKLADFASKQAKLPDWGPAAIKYGAAVLVGMWASKKGIL